MSRLSRSHAEDEESSNIWSAGLVIRDLPLVASNFRSEKSLQAYLLENNIVAISDIDTRRLTRILRDKGAQGGCIAAGADIDEAAVIEKAKAFTGLANAYYGSQALGLAKDAFKEDKFQKNRDFAARRTDFNNNTSARNAQNASFGLASRRQLIS